MALYFINDALFLSKIFQFKYTVNIKLYTPSNVETLMICSLELWNKN